MRILLFLATNIAVMALASIVMVVLQATGILPPNMPYVSSMIYCAVFGMGGAFISLAMSKTMAKRSVGAVVIETPRNPTEEWLVNTVRAQAERAKIGMPEVAIFNSQDPNAFATGMFKNSALVAVSTGLLQLMDKDEVEAVLGHEISHVANGDMVTLALIQGVVNTFVIFAARLVASQFRRGEYLVYIGAQMLFGVFASIIVAWFSRRREFRADAGGADLKSAEAMASALGKLKMLQGAPSGLPEGMNAFGIRDGVPKFLSGLLATHPPLDVRIAALRAH
ncbi:MAG: protease HtpX [Polyangiales bacterium]